MRVAYHADNGGTIVSTLSDYVEEIVKPTFKEFEQDQTPRRAFLAAVAIFHSVDRAKADRKAAGRKKKGENLRNDWGSECMAFKIVDAVCHRFKHTQSDLEPRKPPQWGGNLSISTITHIDGAWPRRSMAGADTPASPRASRACCRARGRVE
jgi:hypothetical protein